MTPDELARLRALCDAATPGPWTYEGQSGAMLEFGHFNGEWMVEEDAAFIAAARTALQALIDAYALLFRQTELLALSESAAVESCIRLGAEVERLRSELDERDQLAMERNR